MNYFELLQVFCIKHFITTQNDYLIKTFEEDLSNKEWFPFVVEIIADNTRLLGKAPQGHAQKEFLEVRKQHITRLLEMNYGDAGNLSNKEITAYDCASSYLPIFLKRKVSTLFKLAFVFLHEKSDSLTYGVNKLLDIPIPETPFVQATFLTRVQLQDLREILRFITRETIPENDPTVLPIVARYASLAELQRIIEAHSIDIHKTNLFEEAIKGGNLINASYLLDIGSTKPGNTLWSVASLSNNKKVVTFLLEKKLLNKDKINEKDTGGSTPFLLAVKNGSDPKFLAFLLEKGANSNSVNNNGETLLHFAINQPKVINWLIKKPELISPEILNQKDQNGMTPLLLAVQKGYSLEYLELLVKKGADLNAVNKDGATVFHLAIAPKGGPFKYAEITPSLASNYSKILDWLFQKHKLDAAIHLDMPNKWGQTPLLCALRMGNIEAAKKFIKKDCNLFVKENAGQKLPIDFLRGDTDPLFSSLRNLPQIKRHFRLYDRTYLKRFSPEKIIAFLCFSFLTIFILLRIFFPEFILALANYLETSPGPGLTRVELLSFLSIMLVIPTLLFLPATYYPHNWIKDILNGRNDKKTKQLKQQINDIEEGIDNKKREENIDSPDEKNLNDTERKGKGKINEDLEENKENDESLKEEEVNITRSKDELFLNNISNHFLRRRKKAAEDNSSKKFSMPGPQNDEDIGSSSGTSYNS